MSTSLNKKRWCTIYKSDWRRRIYFLQVLFICFVLVGCQVSTPEGRFESVTLSPTRTESVTPHETLPPTLTRDTLVDLMAPTLITEISPITTELPTLSPTKMLATPSPTATIVLTGTPISPAFTGAGFLLYGITNSDEESEIHVVQPGGKNHFITMGQMLSGQAISPNGINILVDTNDWTHPPLSPDKIFILNLKTGETSPINLLAHPRSGVFWSADGASLLYVDEYSDDAVNKLILYDISTGENKVLVEMEHILFTAGWAMDERTVAFVAEVDGQYDLYSVNSDTLERHQLTNDVEIETLALWSPTSPQILVGTAPDVNSAFEGWPWGISKLYLLDRNSGHWQLVVEKWFGSESISWSPDGKQIVFSDEGLLCIKNLETMVETCPLGNVAPYNEYFAAFWEPPVWTEDGTWLAFRAYNDTCDMVYFLELATNSIVPSDLKCDVVLGSPIAPIYWSAANLPEFH